MCLIFVLFYFVFWVFFFDDCVHLVSSIQNKIENISPEISFYLLLFSFLTLSSLSNPFLTFYCYRLACSVPVND